MSGTFPTSPAPASASLDSKQPVVTSMSVSGKKQNRIYGGHLWMAKMSWSKMPRAELSPIFAFTQMQRGMFGTFQVVLPNYATPNGVASGSPKSSVSHSAGDSSVIINGWSGGSVNGIMKGGDILKFASHSKVYMVDRDIDSIAGSASVKISPPLIQDISSSDTVTVNNVPFTMSFDDGANSWKGSAPNLASMSVSMTESL